MNERMAKLMGDTHTAASAAACKLLKMSDKLLKASGVVRDDIASLCNAVNLLKDAADILAGHARAAKVRRRRVQWIDAGAMVGYVARVGKDTYQYKDGRIYRKVAFVFQYVDSARSLEHAATKIRRMRKK